MSALFAHVGKDKVEADSVIRSTSQVISLAEIEGTPLILSGDSKGVISVWQRSSGDRRREDPDHHFLAHNGATNIVLVLRSSRIPNLVEECEWPGSNSKNRRFSATLEQQVNQRRSGSDLGTKIDGQDKGSLAALNPTPAPLSGDQGVDSVDDTPPRNCLSRWLSKLCPRCCCQCCRCSRSERGKYWMLASAGDDGALRIWRLRSLSSHDAHTSHDFEADFITEWFSRSQAAVVSCLELHDGTLAMALKESHDVLVVDPGAATVKWIMYGHVSPVTALAQCVDGRIATGGVDGAVRLWERRTWVTDSDLDCDGSGKAWADPEQNMPGVGVSSMAFFAHAQQQQKSESVKVFAHVYVQRAENLPKADLFGASDPYVIVSLNTGLPDIVRSRTPSIWYSGQKTVFEHRCSLPLAYEIGEGPEGAVLDFEVYSMGASRCCGKAVVIGHYSIPVNEIVADLIRDPAEAKKPSRRQLHAPIGEGPFPDLKKASLLIGFEQQSPKTLDCLVESAEFLPLKLCQKAYVVVTMHADQCNAGSKVRCVTSKVPLKTSTILKNLNPIWDELLEIEIPATHKDHRLEYPKDVSLHFEVWDYDTVSTDDLLATMDLPLAVALENDGKDISPYNLTLKPGRKPRSKNPSGKKKSSGKKNLSELSGSDAPSMLSANQKAEAAADTLRLSALSEADDGYPRLFLGFQLVTPCPKQLQCTIEHATGIPAMPRDSAPMVRLRFVEGHPVLPHVTRRQTRVIKHSGHPSWNEQCTLPVPESYIKYCFRKAYEQRALMSKADPSSLLPPPVSTASKPPPPASVRLGWEHEAQEPPPLVFIAEVFAKHSGADTLVGSCTLSLERVLLDIKDKRRWQTPERVDLSDNVGFLYLGFEYGQGTDLLVNIEKAERLPAHDYYCLVHIAERGAFRQPSEKLQCASLTHCTNPVDENKQAPVFEHEMLLDLPGSWLSDQNGGKVAMRPNWYAHIEVIESDDYLHKEVPIMEGFLSLTELLSELATKDMPKPEPSMIRSRIDALRWGQYTDIKMQELPACDIEKDVELIALRSRRKGAQLDVEASAESQPEVAPNVTEDFSGSRTSPAPLAALTPNSATISPRPHSASSLSPDPRPNTASSLSPDPRPISPTTLSSQKSVTSKASSNRLLRLFRRTPETGNEIIEEVPNGSLRLRFKVVSRWDGLARDRSQPLARSMPKASPVTCMMILSTRLFVGYENGNIFVWDVSGSNSVPLHQFEAHRVPISGIAYLQRGDVVVTTGLPRSREEAVIDSVMRTWSAANLQLQQTISLHTAATRTLIALSPDAQRKNAPCLALATETRQSKLIQMMRYKVDR